MILEEQEGVLTLALLQVITSYQEEVEAFLPYGLGVEVLGVVEVTGYEEDL